MQESCKVLTRRGQVHVFGQYVKAIAIRVSRKMDQTPDFAILRPSNGSPACFDLHCNGESKVTRQEHYQAGGISRSIFQRSYAICWGCRYIYYDDRRSNYSINLDCVILFGLCEGTSSFLVTGCGGRSAMGRPESRGRLRHWHDGCSMHAVVIGKKPSTLWERIPRR